jgi:hypothetical protein
MSHVRRLEIMTNERISGADVALISQLTDFTRIMVARTLHPKIPVSGALDTYSRETWRCGESQTPMEVYALNHTSYTGIAHHSIVLRLTKLGFHARPAMLTRTAFTRLMAMWVQGETVLNLYGDRMQVFLTAMAHEDYDFTMARDETLSRIMDVMAAMITRIGMFSRVVDIKIRDVQGSTLFVINYVPESK